MALLILRHVDAHHRVFVVKEEFGQGARRLGLADARRPQEEEAAQWSIGVLQASAGGAHGVGDGGERLVLPDDTLAQVFLGMHQLLDLALHQPRHRDAGPLADDLGDVLLADLLAHELVPLVRCASCC